ALRAGADGLMHGIIDEPVDQEFLDLMKRNKAVYVATSSLYEDVADVASWARRQAAYDEAGRLSAIVNGFIAGPGAQQFEATFNNSALTKRLLPTQRANLKKVFDAGVPVVMGTDAGFLGILMGVSSQAELALMVEAGLTPDAALAAATINAARMLGREATFGTIETGKQADMIVLDADPLADIGNVRRIHRVIKGGVVHDPGQLLAGMRTLPPAGVDK
ncbi:MAG TPA: amidohydrolase family protein, partial [Vicinamibacterales bacterium]|nr:amidohydrolase family protein [Vicinamibacterales bacterium]